MPALNLNPVSKLQELMVSEKKSFPTYTYKCVGSQPELSFICTVKVSDVEANGEGRSKKIAKAIAADNALILLGRNSNNSPNAEKLQIPRIDLDDFSENMNYTGELHELASIQGVGYPIYEMPVFCANGHFKLICKFQGFESEGCAENKKKAKQIASYKMLEKQKTHVQNINLGDMVKSSSDQKISTDIQISSKEQTVLESSKTSPFILEPHPEPEIED